MAFWQKIPIPANSLPGIADPAEFSWQDSDLSQGWSKSWFDSYRVLTIADNGDLNPLHGYLEFEKTHLVDNGDAIQGFYGNPVCLTYLGEAICRLSGVDKPVSFSLLPEDVVLHPVLSTISLINPGGGIPGAVRAHHVFRKLRLGQAFVFTSPEFAARVIRRLSEFCEVKWLTANGWHWTHPLRQEPRSNYTLPFLGGTLVIISADPKWAAVMRGGQPGPALVNAMAHQEANYNDGAGFIPDGPPEMTPGDPDD